MPTDPLRTYADLYHRAVECRKRLDTIRGVIAGAAEALENRPEHFRFDGLKEVRRPFVAATAAFARVEEWPSAAQIQQAVADWHATAERLVDAWEVLSQSDREMLARSSPETAQIPRLPAYAPAERDGAMKSVFTRSAREVGLQAERGSGNRRSGS